MIPVVILFHRNEHLLNFYYKPMINLSPVTFPCCSLWNQAQRGLVICPRSHSFGANPDLASKPYSFHYTSVVLFINMCQLFTSKITIRSSISLSIFPTFQKTREFCFWIPVVWVGELVPTAWRVNEFICNLDHSFPKKK